MTDKYLPASQPVVGALSEIEIRNWWASENGLEDCDMCKMDDFRTVVRAVESKLATRSAAPVAPEPMADECAHTELGSRAYKAAYDAGYRARTVEAAEAASQPAEAMSDEQPSVTDWQRLCTEKHGFQYVRAPDDHWVECTQAQAVDMLRDVLGVDVRIAAPTQAPEQASPEVAELEPCNRCGGSGVVDDGEIDCYENGTPYANGPIKCVKDCPACKGQAAAGEPAKAEPIDERKEFDKIHVRGVGAPSFRIWSKWNEIEKVAAWEAWQVRAGLAAPIAEDAARMAFLAEHWKSEIEGKRLHDWLGDIGTLMKHGSLRKAIDFARTLAATQAAEPREAFMQRMAQVALDACRDPVPSEAAAVEPAKPASAQAGAVPINCDGEESRAGFRLLDQRMRVRDLTAWQVWREAVRWMNDAGAPGAGHGSDA